MKRAWVLIVAIAGAVFTLLVLLGDNAAGVGGRLAAYLKRRDDAERRARAAADASLARLNRDIVAANKEIHDDSAHPADTLNRAGR